MTRETYRVEICGLVRQLPIHEVSPGVRVAVFNMLGDAAITRVAGTVLAERIVQHRPEVVVTAETKSIPLAYEMAAQLHVPYIVLRKERKPYMGETLSVETLSITTAKPQALYLDEKDRELLKGKRVAIVDDVVSTGSTLRGMRTLVERAGADVVAEAAVFTEGDRRDDVVALGHLPVFITEAAR